jgi:hypothetical protein
MDEGDNNPDDGRLFSTGRRRMVIEYPENDDVQVALQELVRSYTHARRDEGDLTGPRIVAIQQEYRHWGAP